MVGTNEVRKDSLFPSPSWDKSFSNIRSFSRHFPRQPFVEYSRIRVPFFPFSSLEILRLKKLKVALEIFFFFLLLLFNASLLHDRASRRALLEKLSNSFRTSKRGRTLEFLRALTFYFIYTHIYPIYTLFPTAFSKRKFHNLRINSRRVNSCSNKGETRDWKRYIHLIFRNRSVYICKSGRAEAFDIVLLSDCVIVFVRSPPPFYGR